MEKRTFFRHGNEKWSNSVLLIIFSFLCTPLSAVQDSVSQKQGPFLANGVKIGELTSSSVRFWIRLTRVETPDLNAPKLIRSEDLKQSPLPEGYTLDQVEGAVPGAPGQVRVTLQSSTSQKIIRSPWQYVDPEQNFTKQIPMENLEPGTAYHFTVEARSCGDSPVSASLNNTFRTSPSPDQPVDLLCTSLSCHEWWDRESNEGQRIYQSMLALNPDFCVHTGDYVYYDRTGPIATSVEFARHKWNRMNALPNVIAFYSHVPSYFEKDDHDTFCNDCAPGMPLGMMGDFTFEQGVRVHYEQVPMVPFQPYRTFRWGKDLQIWLVEGREFRTPHYSSVEPRTIWGSTQIEWFKKTVLESDAAFKILFSPSPLVGPDRRTKLDNYANTPFLEEGRILRRFIADQKYMYVVTGDRHWQYASVDPETGLREYSQGPGCDEHAGGWKPQDKRPEHLFLRVKGGFLSVRISRTGETPAISFNLHDVDGNIVFTDTIDKK